MTVHAAIALDRSGAAAGIGFRRRAAPGTGLPLVLLHGIGSNAKSFEPLMAALPASVDAVAWNAPGYAGSQSLPSASPLPSDYAASLARLLDALALTRVVLLGHSLGALFAAAFAVRFPDRVAALALVSPALGYRVAPGEQLPPGVQARIDEIQLLGPSAFAAKRAARLVHAPERKPDVVAAVQDAMAAVDPAGYVQAARALGAGDLLADASAIKAPAVVAVGADDIVTPPANARAVHAALPGALAFAEIADAGHALPQENPAALARLVMQLKEHCNG
jgi:pimeloyl-ACP methyl ester carboxylesterase